MVGRFVWLIRFLACLDLYHYSVFFNYVMGYPGSRLHIGMARGCRIYIGLSVQCFLFCERNPIGLFCDVTG